MTIRLRWGAVNGYLFSMAPTPHILLRTPSWWPPHAEPRWEPGLSIDAERAPTPKGLHKCRKPHPVDRISDMKRVWQAVCHRPEVGDMADANPERATLRVVTSGGTFNSCRPPGSMNVQIPRHGFIVNMRTATGTDPDGRSGVHKLNEAASERAGGAGETVEAARREGSAAASR